MNKALTISKAKDTKTNRYIKKDLVSLYEMLCTTKLTKFRVFFTEILSKAIDNSDYFNNHYWVFFEDAGLMETDSGRAAFLEPLENMALYINEKDYVYEDEPSMRSLIANWRLKKEKNKMFKKENSVVSVPKCSHCGRQLYQYCSVCDGSVRRT